MPKSPLIMECPVCGAVGNHTVDRTLPKAHELPGLEKLIVAKRAFHGGTYRIRMKTCAKNGCKFDSVELDRDTFNVLLGEIQRERKHRDKLRAVINTFRETVTAADDLLGTTARNKILEKIRKPNGKK